MEPKLEILSPFNFIGCLEGINTTTKKKKQHLAEIFFFFIFRQFRDHGTTLRGIMGQS